MALSKKEMAALDYLAKAIIDGLKENSTSSQKPAEGRKSAHEANSSAGQKKGSSKKSATSEKKTLAWSKMPRGIMAAVKDFEPKGSKCEEGYMNWSSYKSQRTKYCYFVATNGEVKDGKVFGTPWYGKIDFAEDSVFAKAKERFEKHYHYIKVEDRA